MKTIVTLKKETSDSLYIPKDNELIYIDGYTIVCGDGVSTVQELISNTIISGGNSVNVI